MDASTTGAWGAGHTRGLATLLGLPAVLAVAGWALVTLVGPPDVPTSLPSWDEISLLARSPMISFAALRPLLTPAIWLLWS